MMILQQQHFANINKHLGQDKLFLYTKTSFLLEICVFPIAIVQKTAWDVRVMCQAATKRL